MKCFNAVLVFALTIQVSVLSGSANVYASPLPPPPGYSSSSDPSTFRCGQSWDDANIHYCTAAVCPTGDDNECPTNQTCFGGLTAFSCGESSSNSYTNSNSISNYPVYSPDMTYPITFYPGSENFVSLFTAAARISGVPTDWATDQNLWNVVNKESGGIVGIPNYTMAKWVGPSNLLQEPGHWPNIWAGIQGGSINGNANDESRRDCIGLGQLCADANTIQRYYPSGVSGIGDPLSEAAGMLKYIQDRYGSPANAWQHEVDYNWY